MIRYIRHNQIDKVKWDACIEHADNSLIYAYSWYLDITSPNWDALILDDYSAVMPLTWKRKFGIKYLVQPYFSQQLGIFGKSDAFVLGNDFIERIPMKFLHIRININRWINFDPGKFTILNRTNFELNLQKDYDSLFENFATSTKKNIKESNKKNLKISELNDLDRFIDYTKSILNQKISLPGNYYSTLNTLCQKLTAMDSVKLYGIFKDKDLCAATMMIRSDKRWIYQISVSDRTGLKNKAMFNFFDWFIRKNSGSDHILDFEGSDIKGIYDFYNNFGATKTTYHFIQKNKIPLMK